MASHKPIWILALLWGVGLSACRQTTAPKDPEPRPIVAPPTLERFLLRTQTTRLRVRQTPDLEGAVLQILPEGSLVEYLHDSTQFTTPIVYNRVSYDAHWYKVQTEEQNEGWVYAAFVHFLPPRENRRLIAQREAAALQEAANEAQAEQKEVPSAAERSEQVDERLLNTYRNALAQLPQQPTSVEPAVARYKSLFIGRANKRTHDAAYVAFRNWYNRLLKTVQDQYRGQFQYLAGEIERYERANMQGSPVLQVLGANGFNLAFNGDQVVLAEDVDWIFRTFYREMSTSMRAYMNQYELEEPNFWYQKEQLKHSPTQLARWVLSWNYFVVTYPDFVWHDNARSRLSFQLGLLLEGSAGQPAFGADRQLQTDYKAAYTYIAERYPKSKIGQAFQRYLDVLEANDERLSSTVKSARQQLRESILNL